MRIPRIYIEQPLSSGDNILLPQDKAHHLSHVLRIRVGDVITLFNDTGKEFNATISQLTKKSTEVEITDIREINNESSLKIILCLAVSRGQHMDYSIQKAVELGVHTIVPVMSEYSNVKLQSERIQKKMTHWQSIIINATEQCGRVRITRLYEPVSFAECLDLSISKKRLILHPGTQQAMPAITLNSEALTLMIGPEGGFSHEEIDAAIAKETIPVNLGPRILRAETAVVTALSNAQQLWGDLK
jgi:16S rRNA (uracil1498-N3)-methyltransferase